MIPVSFSEANWDHKDNENYYEKRAMVNAWRPQEVPYMKSVCWFRPIAYIENFKVTKEEYRFYIR